MAKVAKSKKREISTHSRAFRRAASPQPDLTKGLPKKSSAGKEKNEHWLYTAQGSGVHKKVKAKKLTHSQRQRQVKALEHAEKIIDKHETKVEKSKRQSRKIQARAAAWEELNGVAGEGAVKGKAEGVTTGADEEWEDEDEDPAGGEVDLERSMDAIIAEKVAPATGNTVSSEVDISKHAEASDIDEIT